MKKLKVYEIIIDKKKNIIRYLVNCEWLLNSLVETKICLRPCSHFHSTEGEQRILCKYTSITLGKNNEEKVKDKLINSFSTLQNNTIQDHSLFDSLEKDSAKLREERIKRDFKNELKDTLRERT